MIRHLSSIAFIAIAIATIGASATVRAADVPDIVYLNRCAATCAVAGGTNDAVNGKSSIISGNKVAPAFPYSDAIFDATAACVRSTLAKYNIEVRITSPVPSRVAKSC